MLARAGRTRHSQLGKRRSFAHGASEGRRWLLSRFVLYPCFAIVPVSFAGRCGAVGLHGQTRRVELEPLRCSSIVGLRARVYVGCGVGQPGGLVGARRRLHP